LHYYTNTGKDQKTALLKGSNQLLWQGPRAGKISRHKEKDKKGKSWGWGIKTAGYLASRKNLRAPNFLRKINKKKRQSQSLDIGKQTRGKGEWGNRVERPQNPLLLHRSVNKASYQLPLATGV